MNVRNVLKVYGLLRQFSDDETALLETLRAFTDAEREAMVEILQPAKAAKKATTTRLIEHCVAELLNGDACGMTRRAAIHKESSTSVEAHQFLTQAHLPDKKAKSARASSLAGAIQNTPKRPLEGGVSRMRCAHVGEDDDAPCGEYADNPIHDKSLGYGNYHPFVSSSSARVAAGRSSTSSIGANLGTDSEDVGLAAGGD